MTTDKKTPQKTVCSKETIFALATGSGRAGVAIIRVSGTQAAETLKSVTQTRLPKARLASVRKLYDTAGEKLDEALVLWFVGPASFTGEDMAELHIHGGTAIVEAVSETLFALGLRQAEAGEFTRRAFTNGKMDLTEAEGLADLIDAETQGQRKQALRQMQGGLRDRYEVWRSKIIDALANVEGEIDFPDEGDVPDALAQRAGAGLLALSKELTESLADSHRGERVRHGVEVAIIGVPNVGKSSIINRLAEKDAAIVSPEAGTTRDIVDVYMQIEGIPVRFSDTAGLRITQNAIEAEGVRRARMRADEADLRLLVIDPEIEDSVDVLEEAQDGDFILYNKADLKKTPNPKTNVSRETFCISAKTGQGFDGFEQSLRRFIAENYGTREQAGLTRARHVNCVKTTLTAIKNAYENLSIAPELAGADLHEALHAIKELAGETDIEAVLDRVFTSFCIGK